MASQPAQNPAVEPSEADGHPISNLGGNEKTPTQNFAKKTIFFGPVVP